MAAKAEVNDEITNALSRRPQHMSSVVTKDSRAVEGTMSIGVIAKAMPAPQKKAYLRENERA